MTLSLALAAPSAAEPDPEPAPEPAPTPDVPRAHVVGGQPAEAGRWPWMAALVVTGGQGQPVPFCGGTLVAPRWVLTAAHCVEGLDGLAIAAHVGLEDFDDAVRPIDVQRVVVHPAYVDLPPWPHDVALLELDTPADVTPVRLATGADWPAAVPGTDALTIGWGAIDPESTDYPTVLHEAITPVVSDLSCAGAVGGNFEAALMLCAGASGRASCTGDSGGPLVGQAGGSWRQLGVVSSGRGRCGSDPHNIYVQVATVLPWIAEVLGADLGADAATRDSVDDGYATAAAITRSAYDAEQLSVFVASSAAFPDGLVGGALAAPRGPLLLVPPDGELPEAVREELTRLAPETITVFGGPAAIAPGTVEALQRHAPTSRIAGADRYATAAEVARSWGPVSTVFVATGETYPDALAAVPLTLGRGPVVLTRGDRVPVPTREVLAQLAPSRVVVLGGPTAVDAEVQQELADLTGAAVRRVAGADRYDTAARVVLDEDAPQAPSTAYVATGEDFPDALVGGVVAAAHGAPVLLVPPDRVPQSVAEAVERLAPRRVVVLGDHAAISPAVADALHARAVRLAMVEPQEAAGSAVEAFYD